MSAQRIDAAVALAIADVLERIQTHISKEYKSAENGSESEQVYSKLEDILGDEIENLREIADEDDDE